MDNTLKIGKYIRQFLVDDQEYLKLVGPDKTFPIIAAADTTFPFLTYQRAGVTVSYTKDGRCQNRINEEITICASTYAESIDIVCLVRNILEGKRYKDDDICIYNIRVDSVSEEFVDDTFIQRISFDIDAI